MILTRDWVFVHMPKTGGSFVRKLMRAHAPQDWQMRELHEHVPASETPDSHRERPKFGFARHPLTWYVSWYHYLRQQPKGNKRFLEASDGGSRSFAETLRAIFSMPRNQGTVERGIPGGPFTQYLQIMFGPGLELATVFKMETLREDLIGFLRNHGEVPEALEVAALADAKVNTSGHGGWRAHYDAELEALVRERDAAVFEHFGYT